MSYVNPTKVPVLFSWSGGKDSALALNMLLKDPSYKVVSLLTTVTEGYERISMHGVRNKLLNKQGTSLNLPIESVLIPKNCSNKVYEERLERVLLRYKLEGIHHVVFGDIFLEDLRAYREERLNSLGLKGLFPIWKQPTKALSKEFINLGFKAVLVCIDSQVLSSEFVGREYDKDLLKDLPNNIDPCGEYGEFHTFVYDGPLFQKRIEIKRGEIVFRENRFYYCDFS